MALSDYDTLALDINGTPVANFVGPDGVIVDPYKNWLYIRDKQAWQEGHFTGDVVMHFNSGELQYRGLHLFGKRDASGQKLFFIATFGYDLKAYEDRGKQYPERQQTGIVGVTRSGYVYPPPPPYPTLPKDMSRAERSRAASCRRLGIPYKVKRGKLIMGKQPHSVWEGVTPADVTVLRKMVVGRARAGYISKRWLDLDWDKAVRFNQGDAYFAGHGLGDLPISKPGEAEEPILIQALKQDQN